MADNVVRFPPPSGPVQLRTLLNEHLRNYPDAASRRRAASQLKIMGTVARVILGPGSFQELGLQPLLDRKVIVNHGKGEYGAVDADTKRFFASMTVDVEGFIQ
jgi:hypothetical protein